MWGVRPPSRSIYPNLVTGEPDESAIPEVCRYVFESIQSLDEVVVDIERAGGTNVGYKCAFLQEGLKIVTFVCNSDGRHPEVEKVQRIVDWPACRDITEAKSVIGLCVDYCLWIAELSLVSKPIFRLFRRVAITKSKGKRTTAPVEFVWGLEQREAMKSLKATLITAPALKPIVYKPNNAGFLGRIILEVDASKLGYGAM